MTQEELAARSGVSVRAIGDLERDRSARPYLRSVRLLAGALELTDAQYGELNALARESECAGTGPAGPSQLPAVGAQFRSSGEFTQAVIHVTDVRAAVEEMRGRGVEFEKYDTPETRTENGVARMPGGGEAAWFKDSEGNLVGVVPA
jgi:transcriptional regulator with XRE-family HTH domain